MSSLRDFSIKYLNSVGKTIPTNWLIRATNQRYILPFYHAVSNEDLPHIKNLYRVKNVREFESDLDFLLRYFTPVDFQKFKEVAGSTTKLRKPVFLLSFDDGLRSFHDVIAPILIKKGIPAICFLNSAFVNNKDLFFKYKASTLVSFLQQHPNLHQNPDIKQWLSQNNVSDVNAWLLSIEYHNRNILDEIAVKIGFDFDHFLDAEKPYLTSEQINKLINSGFHFGAHSIDHPEYRFIPFEEQTHQTTESLAFVKHKLGVSYSLFSFPFTDHQISDKFFQNIFSEKLADLTFGGAGLKKERYPFHFQRIAFERGDLHARDIYKTELIYSCLQSIVGKNVIKRT